MCCALLALVVSGPRLAIFIWWLVSSSRWSAAIGSFWIGFVGFLFLPWTTLAWVLVAPTGTASGFDWFVLAIAFLADLASYSGGIFGRRRGYYSR